MTGTGSGERSGHQQALEAGTRFAGLTVSHVLGYGNFGITYKALDDLGQIFVVVTLVGDARSPRYLQTAIREGHLAARAIA